MQQEFSGDLPKNELYFSERMWGKKIGNASTAVNKAKLWVPVTKLRYLVEHLNQLYTVDTVGGIVFGQFKFALPFIIFYVLHVCVLINVYIRKKA